MANKRIKDLPVVTATTTGDVVALDGATTRSVTVENFLGDNLVAVKSLTTAADKLAYFNGAGTADITGLTAQGRALLDDADAAAQRATIGLDQVDNTSDATKNAAAATLTNKTIDTAGPNTIKINGNTLDAAAGVATVTLPNTTDTLVGRDTFDTLTNKTLTSPTINSPSGLVKGDVGLGNVDNTSDLDKPISTATQSALNLKANSADLKTVATTGAYSDLTGKPTLGTAAATDAADYATAAQGSKADTALQSVVAGANVTVDNTDPRNPIVSSTGGGGGGPTVFSTPEMFGAAGNGDGAGGGTNDAVAIQNAINDANLNKRPLLFSRTVYRCDAGLNIPAGVELLGYGATLDFKSAGDVTGILFANGGSVSGLTLLGSGNSIMGSGKAIECLGVNNSPAAPTYVSAPTIRDCIIDGWSMYGVFIGYVNRGLINNCKITNIGYAGVGGVSCNDTIVDGNEIDGVAPGNGSGDAYGIFLDRYSGLGETDEPRSFRCSIVNNIVKNVVNGSGSNGQGIDTHAGVEFRIIGNTVINCQVGIFITASAVGGVPTYGPKRCVVQGNTISGAHVGYGILISGAISGSTVNEYAEDCIISDNVINGHGAAGTASVGAVQIQGTKNLVVSGNLLKRSRNKGVILNFNNFGFVISNNVIIDPFDNTFTAPSCIAVDGNNNRGYIGTNTFRFDDGGVGTYVAVRSIAIAGSLTGLDIDIDRCSFIGIDASHLSYSELTSVGVNASNLMTRRGKATITITSGSANNVVTVSFGGLLPSTPKSIIITNSDAIAPGGKTAVLRTGSVTSSGFNIVAYPYDLSSWSASGSMIVDWVATT